MGIEDRSRNQNSEIENRYRQPKNNLSEIQSEIAIWSLGIGKLEIGDWRTNSHEPAWLRIISQSVLDAACRVPLKVPPALVFIPGVCPPRVLGVLGSIPGGSSPRVGLSLLGAPTQAPQGTLEHVEASRVTLSVRHFRKRRNRTGTGGAEPGKNRNG